MTDSCKIRYYIPAHDEDVLREAIESDVEVIIMDLEQNCPSEKKDAGRLVAFEEVVQRRHRHVVLHIPACVCL